MRPTAGSSSHRAPSPPSRASAIANVCLRGFRKWFTVQVYGKFFFEALFEGRFFNMPTVTFTLGTEIPPPRPSFAQRAMQRRKSPSRRQVFIGIPRFEIHSRIYQQGAITHACFPIYIDYYDFLWFLSAAICKNQPFFL